MDEERYVNATESYDLRIYTDGSKIGGRVGAALFFWESEAERKTVKLALPSYCTVYQAELLALNRAVCKANRGGRSPVGIFSDSRSALEAVTMGSPHPLVEHIRSVLREALLQGREISLFWIKAHAGMRGNERVDQLAKEAALGLKKKPDYDMFPVSFVKRELRKGTIDEWEERYVSGETAGGKKLFFLSAAAAYKIITQIDITHHTTQFITGYGGFSSYLKRFKCADNSSCACDDDTEETVSHVLCECPIFANDRFNIDQELGITLVGENLSVIMSSKGREKFINFCIEITKKVNLKNGGKLAIT